MKYGEVSGVTKPVSRLALGTMIVSTDCLEPSFALLDAALATGWNTLDTAHIYGGGKGERAVGQWLHERGNRERVVVLTRARCTMPTESG